MYALIVLLTISLQSATVIDVEPHTVTGVEAFTLAIRLGDMIYAADFPSSRNLRATDYTIGDQIQAAVRRGTMTIRRRDGKTATATISRKERVLVEPRYLRR